MKFYLIQSLEDNTINSQKMPKIRLIPEESSKTNRNQKDKRKRVTDLMLMIFSKIYLGVHNQPFLSILILRMLKRIMIEVLQTINRSNKGSKELRLLKLQLNYLQIQMLFSLIWKVCPSFTEDKKYGSFFSTN